MAGNFNVNYNAGGVVDEVKKIKLIKDLENVDNIVNVEVVEDVKLVEEVKLVDEVGVVDNVKMVDEVGIVDEVKVVDEVTVVDEVKVVDELKLVDEVAVVDEVKMIDEVAIVDDVKNVDTVQDVKMVDEVGHIKGFATHTQPFNTMKMYKIPALLKDPLTGLDYEFNITLPDIDVEIMAMSLTCSGYGEGDHYDMYVNGVQWFDNWYCSEVKEGLFLGTSTYVYAAPPSSNIKLVFKNDSGTSKDIWFGIRMLVN